VAKLIYPVITSLDGYIADEEGSFDWAEPDEEVHAFVNDLERAAGTYLYGRRVYETMAGWETDPSFAASSPAMRDFAEIWQAAEKVVYSRTLDAIATSRTRIEREFDPAAVRGLKESAESDLLIGGANLAASAFAAGLIDECHVFLAPVLVGAGNRCWPDRVRVRLEPLEDRRFDNGMVFVRYRATT
jgi:dihydrofolate reductase